MNKIKIFTAVFFIIALILFGNNISIGNPNEMKVSTDFDSGKLGKYFIKNDTLLCYPYINYDENGRNGVTIWFFARLDNVLNREITIQFTGMYVEYNLRVGSPPYSRGKTAFVYSYDLENWQRITNYNYDAKTNTYTVIKTFNRNRVWISYIEPYPYSRLEKFIKEIKNNQYITLESIGKSVEGRELYFINVSESFIDIDSRPVVWIIARQHPWETAGTWASEGIIRYLISDNPDAVKIRKNITFKILPIANPDGVVNGVTRFNAKGVDLNRHWDKSDPISSDIKMAPEIALLKKAMKKWRSKHRMDMWINIHNNSMGIKNPAHISFCPPVKESEKFGKYLTEESVFRGPVRNTDSAVVTREFNTSSMLIEMEVGYNSELGIWINKKQHIEYGKGLARSIGRFFNVIK